MMNDKAQKIWWAFCSELSTPSTDEMKEALSSALNELINQYSYNHLHIDGDHGLDVINVRHILKLIEELEG
jgi:hypothetical protein